MEENIIPDCYYVIKNIIWKNIINYNIIDNKFHVYMLWTKKLQINYTTNIVPFLNRHIILNKNISYTDKSNDNLDMLYSIIINYLLLLEPIILNYLIVDLSYVLKKYMFDVILMI